MDSRAAGVVDGVTTSDKIGITPAVTPLRPRRQAIVCYFNTWADRLEGTHDYVRRARTIDLSARVDDAADLGLMQKARLDCDWYAENAACFAAMAHPDIDFTQSFVTGAPGLMDFAKLPCAPGTERWLITMAHQPQSLGKLAGKAFAMLRQMGVRHLYYAFDEASRFMPCFREIAPYLDILIHDESPLDAAGEGALRADCRRIHRSWVANCVPYAATFNENPEPKIHFLGSQLGLTEHRKKQIAYLQERFGDRFVATHDHSLSVADRFSLTRYKVGLCPEGRKFTTAAMSRTHTDRPFWCGCLGMVPVSEDSQAGGRLEELAANGLILRYPHGDPKALAEACERALAMPTDERRRIYEHFNRYETVGTVVAEALARVETLKR
jgi:hypothetical protein